VQTKLAILRDSMCLQGTPRLAIHRKLSAKNVFVMCVFHLVIQECSRQMIADFFAVETVFREEALDFDG
jgi:hypothetical protein